MFLAPAPAGALFFAAMKQLHLDDAAIAAAADRTVADCEAQGIDPKLFALRLLYRCTLARLAPFPAALRRQFALWLVEELLADGET